MSDQSRRKLLKSIAAGSGAVVAGLSLPDKWSRPVVDSVLLPAHALTSLEQYTSLISAQTENDSLLATAMDSLIPEAAANGGPKEKTCISLNPDHSVKVEGLLESEKGIAKVTANHQVWIGGDPVEMTVSLCTPDCDCFHEVKARVTDISNGIARGYYLIGEGEKNKVNFYLPAGACSAPACPPDDK